VSATIVGTSSSSDLITHTIPESGMDAILEVAEPRLTFQINGDMKPLHYVPH